MPLKTREELQPRFKQGSKPNEQDFKDFIDSTLNIKEDGLEKGTGTDPLKIKAYGAEENFLDFVGSNHTWRINQKTNDSKTQGLNFATSDGNSKLFIDNSSGNVGISIDQPKAKLHVRQENNEDALRVDDESGDTTPFIINKDGNIGIGTLTPLSKLHIVASGGFGSDDSNGIAQANNVPLVVQGKGTVFGIINGSGREAFALNLESDEGTNNKRGIPTFYDKYDGNWHSSIALKNGKVGIGTADPGTNLLRVNTGSVRFELGPNQKLSLGGNGLFEIDAPNIIGGRFIVTNDGKLGINTNDPSEKLEIRITGGDNQQTNFLSIFNDGGGASQESRIVWKNGTSKQYAAAIASRPGGNYNAGDLRFQTAKKGTLKDQMIIDQDGNVNIAAESGLTNNIDIAGHVQLKEYGKQEIAFLQARDDTSNRNIGLRIRTQKYKVNSNKPELVEALTINPDGIILSNKWNVTTIFDRKGGPLPVTGNFTSSGGSLVVCFGGTGWRGSTGLMALEMYVDNNLYAYTDTWTNESSSHKAFPTTVHSIGRLQSGNHTLKIAGYSNTVITDVNDRFYATVIELPF